MEKRNIFSSDEKDVTSLAQNVPGVSQDALFRFQTTGKRTMKLARTLGIPRRKLVDRILWSLSREEEEEEELSDPFDGNIPLTPPSPGAESELRTIEEICPHVQHTTAVRIRRLRKAISSLRGRGICGNDAVQHLHQRMQNISVELDRSKDSENLISEGATRQLVKRPRTAPDSNSSFEGTGEGGSTTQRVNTAEKSSWKGPSGSDSERSDGLGAVSLSDVFGCSDSSDPSGISDFSVDSSDESSDESDEPETSEAWCQLGIQRATEPFADRQVREELGNSRTDKSEENSSLDASHTVSNPILQSTLVPDDNHRKRTRSVDRASDEAMRASLLRRKRQRAQEFTASTSDSGGSSSMDARSLRKRPLNEWETDSARLKRLKEADLF